MNLDLLREVMDSKKINIVEEMLEEIATTNVKEAVPLLIEYLKSTDNNRLRNAIAINTICFQKH